MWRGADCCAASGRSSRNTSGAVNVMSRLSDARPRFLMSRGNRSITQDAGTTCHTSMIRSIRAHVSRSGGVVWNYHFFGSVLEEGAWRSREIAWFIPPSKADRADCRWLQSDPNFEESNFTFVVWVLKRKPKLSNSKRDFCDFKEEIFLKKPRFFNSFLCSFYLD